MCVCLCVCVCVCMQAKSNVDKWKFETIYAQFTEIAVGHIKLTRSGWPGGTLGGGRAYLQMWEAGDTQEIVYPLKNVEAKLIANARGEWVNEWLRDRMNVPKWQSKLE